MKWNQKTTTGIRQFRRFPALLCAIILVCSLNLPAAGAPGSSTVYLLAANDKFCDLPGEVLPVEAYGSIYIPYTIFDRNLTGVDLGVYYGITPERGTILTLYSLNGMLTFTVIMGRCEDNLGNVMSFYAILRNGIPYVPAAEVCRFFGLQYSILPTSDRGTCIRITNPSASHLNDSSFLTSARSAMTTRYQQILQRLSSQSGYPSVSFPPAQPTFSHPPDTINADVKVYLSLDASSLQGDVTALFPDGVYALLLYTPDSLSTQAIQIRRAVAAGHSVGLLLPDIPDMGAALADLKRGNELLSHIARLRTRIVSVPSGPTASLCEGLEAEGWAIWAPSITAAVTPSSIRTILGSHPSAVQLDLTATAVSSVSRVVSTLRSEGYSLYRPLETNL